MRNFVKATIVVTAALLASSAAAQNRVVIDLNAPMPEFSQADYDKMLACSLERYPEITRRYSEYHLLRRDKQSPAENEADPDSGIMWEALDGCYLLGPGPIPFNIDALVLDWGIAHGMEPMKVTDLNVMADCITEYAADHIDRVLNARNELEELVAFRNFRVAMCDFSGLSKFDKSDMVEVVRILLARKSASEGEK